MNHRANPRLGYGMAVLAAAASGFSIYYNSFGVKLFRDATLYTTLKNSVVGLLLVVPLMLIAGRRQELLRLRRGQWGWLVALALVSGSIPFLLFFRGLQLTNALTGSLLNHLQFAVVAVLAATLLRERITPVMWAGLGLLLAGTVWGLNLGAVRLNEGTALLLLSTVLFGAGFVMAKHLLAGISTLTVMSARMTLGSVALIAYAATTGHLQGAGHLSPAMWQYVLVSGVILTAFTVTTFTAIRHVSVTSVMAIAMASPIATLAIQLATGAHIAVTPGTITSMALTAVAIVVIGAAGIRAEAQPRTPQLVLA